MTLSECCHLLQDVTRVPITILGNDEQKAAFCSTHQIHPVQEHLLPRAMSRFLEEMNPDETMSLVDMFRIRFLFFIIQGTPVAVGPFCTEFFSESDCITLLRHLKLTRISAQDLFAYRGQIAVVNERYLLHMVRSIDRAMNGENHLTGIRRMEYGKTRTAAMPTDFSQKSYTKLVQERYRTEEEFLDAVRRGDVTQALVKWQALHQSVVFLKRLGQTLDNARISAAVVRTALRMAAADVGVPATVNDSVTSESARIVRHAATLEQIEQEQDRLIRFYCKLVSRSRSEQYSSLVQSALYCIDRMYNRPLTVTGLARELEVSPNHLTTAFHRQTGMTFTACLTQTRLQRARTLLITSDIPVREVAAAVGIPDESYFIKQFKRTYGKTPAAFRHSHKL